MPLTTTEIIYLIYFSSHIPITIYFDSPNIIPHHLLSSSILSTRTFYVEFFKYPLVEYAPIWFKSLVLIEFIIQLPFMIFASWMLFTGYKRKSLFLVAYGIHVCTALIPCLGELWVNGGEHWIYLVAFYIPYFIVPLMMGVEYGMELWGILKGQDSKSKRE